MSGSSGSDGGVVRNSALAFVASAQGTMNPGASVALGGPQLENHMNQTEHLMPPGLKALYDVCSEVYPDQQNPLQVTTRLKYWLGGHDPLDYISMFWNPGRPEEHIPPHWHYVSFGLSDLHGDGRVHPEPDPIEPCSGYGLELTFRLESDERTPPLWPATLLQSLARYIFTTGNKFMAGDHVSWHAALDGAHSRLRHLLVAADPGLPPANTPHGPVNFLQMVGCTGRELKTAQKSSGFEVLKMIGEDPKCGGSWLVSRGGRRVSARGCSGTRGCPGAGRARAVDLAGVSARVRWEPRPLQSPQGEATPLSPRLQQEIKDTLQRGLSCMGDRGSEGHKMSTDSFQMSSMEKALPQIPEIMQGSWRGDQDIEYLEGVHVMLNAEGASLLPLAIDGRVLHAHHFTWRQGPRAVTFLHPTVAEAFVTPDKPYACKGAWLQVQIPSELAEDMSKRVAELSRLVDSDSEESDSDTPKPPKLTLPITMNWPRYGLSISVLHDMEIL